jgi:large subunit ribosomal protein L29
MKAVNLREQTDEELRQLGRDTEKELHELRVKRSVAEAAEPPMRLRLLRRDLARIKTVLRERELSHG